VALDIDIVTRLGWLGVSEETLRRRLVAQFSFRESDYTHHHYEPERKNRLHYSDYKKRPTRSELLVAVLAEIERIGATRKRPKVLAGGVVKRVYCTYPEAESFRKRWEAIEDEAERAERVRRFGPDRCFRSRHGKKGNLR